MHKHILVLAALLVLGAGANAEDYNTAMRAGPAEKQRLFANPARTLDAADQKTYWTNTTAVVAMRAQLMQQMSQFTQVQVQQMTAKLADFMRTNLSWTDSTQVNDWSCVIDDVLPAGSSTGSDWGRTFSTPAHPGVIFKNEGAIMCRFNYGGPNDNIQLFVRFEDGSSLANISKGETVHIDARVFCQEEKHTVCDSGHIAFVGQRVTQ